MNFAELERILNHASPLAMLIMMLIVMAMIGVLAVSYGEIADLRRRLALAEMSNKKLREMLIEAHAELGGPLAHETRRSDAALERLLRNI